MSQKIFRADLHIHTDQPTAHGMSSQQAAQAIFNSGLDVCATLAHDTVNSLRHDAIDEKLTRFSERHERTCGVRKEILHLLGIETTIVFEKLIYHLGLIFRSNEHRDAPSAGGNLNALEDYLKSYPAAVILFHPAWKGSKRESDYDREATLELMKHPVIDGVEIINAFLILRNGIETAVKSTRTSMKVFLEAKKAKPLLSPMGDSDAHTPDIVGAAGTIFTGNEPMDIFEAIKGGNTRAAIFRNDGRNLIPRIESATKNLEGIVPHISVNRD
jgi:hypothetical protein